jgi:arylsulfatase A-like enzyme
VYRETTEVPFLISFPFRLEPGLVFQTLTRNVDVWPTVLDLVGLSMPEGGDGRSLRADILELARGAKPSGSSEPAIAHLDQTWGRPERSALDTIAVIEDGMRYVRMAQPKSATTEQLFDRVEDPAEMKDVSDDRPEALAKLREVGDRYLAEQPAWGEAPTRELGELELNQLRALGYAIP